MRAQVGVQLPTRVREVEGIGDGGCDSERLIVGQSAGGERLSVDGPGREPGAVAVDAVSDAAGESWMLDAAQGAGARVEVGGAQRCGEHAQQRPGTVHRIGEEHLTRAVGVDRADQAVPRDGPHVRCVHSAPC